MTEGGETRPSRRREGLVGAVSAGLFLVLLGAILVLTPGLLGKVVDFFTDFGIVEVPNLRIPLPAPENPDAHLAVYSAAAMFSIIWGIMEVALLGLRFFVRSPVNKKAENAGNIAFWFGTYYLIGQFLNQNTDTEFWFAFWAALIALIGVTLIIRAAILAAAR